MKIVSVAVISSVIFVQTCFAQVPPGGFLGAGVTITSPQNHAVFYTPVDLPLFATVSDSLHTTNVEFYAGSTDLGPGVNLGRVSRPPTLFNWSIVNPRLESVWCLVWSNVPAGSYVLTARNSGSNSLGGFTHYTSRTSAPVNITVVSSSAATNGPDVVSVVATDPIAISGTNSWTWWGMTNTTPSWTNWPPPRWQLFTNWGPKNALFTVRRFGDVTHALNVTYALSGTATNGTDYATLPNSVTFPAGAGYALIPVVPIDTGAPYSPKTVVLTLNPPSLAGPPYAIGPQRRAAVVILHDWFRTYVPAVLPGGSFALNAAGPDGAWFNVETSSDLLNWSSAGTNQVFQGSINFVDMNAPSNTAHFYRTTPQSGPPGQ